MRQVRMGALALAVAGAAVLQGCAVATGPYTAQRAPVMSHSMVSRYDKSHYNADGTPPSQHGSALYMPQPRPQGMFFFRYY